MFPLSRKYLFRAGHLVLAGLVGLGAVQGAAAQATENSAATTPAGTKPAAKRASTPRRPLYSAQRSLSRQAALARARSAATAREMADSAVPRYKVDAGGDLVPDVHAAAAIIYNPETGQVLFEENSLSQRSIASITKVMTAVVFFESNPDVSQQVAMERSDVYAASTTHA